MVVAVVLWWPTPTVFEKVKGSPIVIIGDVSYRVSQGGIARNLCISQSTYYVEDNQITRAVFTEDFGFPFRCVRRCIEREWHVLGPNPPFNRLKPSSWSEGILLPNWVQFFGARDTMILPVIVVWPGMGMNLLVYAIVIYITTILGRKVVRGFRVLRGKCPMCAYDLRGEFESGCSECGWNRTGTETKSATEKEMK